jgi:hypothetical protein
VGTFLSYFLSRSRLISLEFDLEKISANAQGVVKWMGNKTTVLTFMSLHLEGWQIFLLFFSCFMTPLGAKICK